jgi:hypothetical protein
VHLLLGTTPDWDVSQHDEVHRTYFRSRPKGLRVPRPLEAGMTLALAERHRAGGDVDRARGGTAFPAMRYHIGVSRSQSMTPTLSPNGPRSWAAQ